MHFVLSDSGHFANSVSEYSANAGLYVNVLTQIPVTDSVFSNNATSGLIVTYSVETVITGNTFTDNGAFGVDVHEGTLSSYTGNTGTGNAWNGFRVKGFVEGSHTWESPSSFPFVIPQGVIVSDGGALAVAEGTVLKFEQGACLNVEGALDANGASGNEVVFTSLRDDDYGGDTNNDGLLSLPERGDWAGILLDGTGDYDGIGEFDYCILRYGGGAYSANVEFYESDSGHFANSVSEYSASSGLHVDACSPEIGLSLITENPNGVYAENGANPTINCSNIFGNTGYGVFNDSIGVIINAQGNWWGDATGPYHPTTNPGGLGDEVSDNVDYGSWAEQPDPPPAFSIDDVSVTEGDAGTVKAVFTVRLSAASSQTVTVDYTTADGTATVADSDYQATSETLTFNPGEVSQPVAVLVNGDTNMEPDETFFVNLSNATNATIADGQGVGTIENDDFVPPTQVIRPDPLAQTVSSGDPVSITVTYSTANPIDETLTGLGLRIHYDSSKLTWDSFSDVFAYGKIDQDTGPFDDTSNFDGDPATDKYLTIAWDDSTGQWPGEGTTPLDLYTANFTASTGSTAVNFSAGSTAAGYFLDAQSATVDAVGPQLRVDSLEVIPSGLKAHFNRQVDPDVLNLYDTEAGIYGPADFTVVGDSVGLVAGSLICNEDGTIVSFIKTGGPLAQVRQIKIILAIFKKYIFDANQSEVILGTISS